MTNAVKHPARYSAPILAAFRAQLDGCPHVHDPFAGTGERLGALCDDLSIPFTGTELEAPYIIDPRVKAGDSRRRETYPWCGGLPERPWWIVTSPVYANGMADNFKPSGICSACGGSGKVALGIEVVGGWLAAAEALGEDCPKCEGTGRRPIRRRTYRISLMLGTGNMDYTLADGNMAAHSYRAGRKARERYWRIAHDVIAQWKPAGATRALVNVSDFPMGNGEPMVEHVAEWRLALRSAGWLVVDTIEVETQRYRDGANRDLRAPAEAILVAAPHGVTP